MTRVDDLHNELDPPEYGPATTLEAFLALPDIEDAPAWEFIDGRMVRKVSPRRKHSALQQEMVFCVNAFSRPRGLGLAFVELRCTFAGRSIVPDVVFQVAEHIELDDSGEFSDEHFGPPDFMIEILSFRQSPARSKAKLVHATEHGCPLGWLLDPYGRKVTVYRPGVPPVEIGTDGFLDGEPVLPGFRLAVAEIFSWLKPPGQGMGE